MIEDITKMKSLLTSLETFFSTENKLKISHKPSEKKWSKKEILGHLIDSGVYNLQRFTEIKFAEKPYILCHYSQEELVDANDYQNADIEELMSFFISLNTRILKVIETYTDEVLDYKIIIYKDTEPETMRFWINDYVNHLEHHLKQILN